MEIKKIKELIKLMEESQLSDLEIKDNNFEIKMSKNNKQTYVESIPVTAIKEEVKTQESISINAPVVGTFYARPSSDKDPYIKVGQRINVGDTICIIEAMKVMSEITADKAGVVIEIIANDGQLVEFDQPMFILE